ncbi:unnamed protein product [Symbiodinium sp. CCMP2456]|nr:unnamed protein product [Symbiodinium sp. CCMP2456]
MADGEADPAWVRPLKLHVAVDAFSPGAAHRAMDSCREPLGLDTLARVLPAVLKQPQLKAQHRASLAMRLRRLLHECISIGDASALQAWDAALAASAATATVQPSAGIAEGHSAWCPVLGFLAFLEVLESGLPAVSRSFARLSFSAATTTSGGSWHSEAATSWTKPGLGSGSNRYAKSPTRRSRSDCIRFWARQRVRCDCSKRPVCRHHRGMAPAGPS